MVQPASSGKDTPVAYTAIVFVKLMRVCLVTQVVWFACLIGIALLPLVKLGSLNLSFDLWLSER